VLTRRTIPSGSDQSSLQAAIIGGGKEW